MRAKTRPIDNVKLKQIRFELNLTQKVVADRAKITLGYYSEIETGKKTPSLATALLLSQGLGVSIGDLIIGNPKGIY